MFGRSIRNGQRKSLIRIDITTDLGMLRPRHVAEEVPLWKVAYWTRRLKRRDHEDWLPTDASARKSIRDQMAGRLRSILYRFRKITDSPELRGPGLAVLAEMIQQGLDLARLLHTELNRDISADGSLPDPETFHACLTQVEFLFRETEQNVRRLHETQRMTARFSDVATELLCRSAPNADVISSFLQQFAKDCQGTVWGHEWIGPPGMSLRKAIRPVRFRSEAYVAANGLLTARLFLTSLGRRWPYISQLHELTAAALLQDVGLLTTENRYDCDVDEFIDRHWDVYCRHPEAGAAIVSGIKGLSIETQRLIQHHHERIDLSGFPDRPLPARLGQAARALAIVARFVDLLETTVVEVDTANRVPGRGDQIRAVSRVLLEEADRGEWDPDLARCFLRSLVPGFAHAELPPGLQPGELPGDDFGVEGVDTADLLFGEDHRQDGPHPESTDQTADVSGGYRPLRRGGRTRWIARES